MTDCSITLQGTFLNIHGVGTLLTGKPGVGKSQLALSLLDRHHQFIADDSPHFRLESGKIIGFNPLPHYILYSRTIGLLDIEALFGAEKVLSEHRLDLIIHLETIQFLSQPQLEPQQTIKDLSGCLIPVETIPIINPRNLEVLIEIIVKRYLLLINKEWSPIAHFDEYLQNKLGQSRS